MLKKQKDEMAKKSQHSSNEEIKQILGQQTENIGSKRSPDIPEAEEETSLSPSSSKNKKKRPPPLMLKQKSQNETKIKSRFISMPTSLTIKSKIVSNECNRSRQKTRRLWRRTPTSSRITNAFYRVSRRHAKRKGQRRWLSWSKRQSTSAAICTSWECLPICLQILFWS